MSVAIRRKDRQVIDTCRIREMLETAQVCRLGLNTGGEQGAAPYIVPLNFGYDYDGEKLTLYFHCAKEGRKIDLIAKDQNAAFELDVMTEIQKGDSPCQYSCGYQSIIGAGKAQIIDDTDEKIKAFIKIMRHIAKKEFAAEAFEPNAVAATGVIRLDVTEFCAKEKPNEF